MSAARRRLSGDHEIESTWKLSGGGAGMNFSPSTILRLPPFGDATQISSRWITIFFIRFWRWTTKTILLSGATEKCEQSSSITNLGLSCAAVELGKSPGPIRRTTSREGSHMFWGILTFPRQVFSEFAESRQDAAECELRSPDRSACNMCGQ